MGMLWPCQRKMDGNIQDPTMMDSHTFAPPTLPPCGKLPVSSMIWKLTLPNGPQEMFIKLISSTRITRDHKHALKLIQMVDSANFSVNIEWNSQDGAQSKHMLIKTTTALPLLQTSSDQ